MTVDVIVGGQFGSEGKGAVACHVLRLRREQDPDLQISAVRVAGPNAGHSAIGILDGKKWALRQVPVMAVVDLGVDLIIAAGSEVDLVVLAEEVEQLDLAGYQVSKRLMVSDEATVIDSTHIVAEHELVGRIGSTGKGIGVARSERLLREAKRTRDHGAFTDGKLRLDGSMVRCVNTDIAVAARACTHHVIIEGTQGYGLGLHAGFYPHCTSSDCRAQDFLAMAGVPVQAGIPVATWIAMRTFPIRVAGNSGPLHAETDWATLHEESAGHIDPERTTVTKKVRRVGRWDPALARLSFVANGGLVEDAQVFVVITFLDYVAPGCFTLSGDMSDLDNDQLADFLPGVQWILRNCDGLEVVGATTGPDSIVWTK